MNVSPYLEFYWNSFRALSAARQSGMDGPQAISISEISAYCDLAGLQNQNCKFEMLEIIQAMDSVYLEKNLEEVEKNDSKTA